MYQKNTQLIHVSWEELEQFVLTLKEKIIRANSVPSSIGPHTNDDIVLAFLLANSLGVDFDFQSETTVSVDNPTSDFAIFHHEADTTVQTPEPKIFVETMMFEMHSEKTKIKMPWNR